MRCYVFFLISHNCENARFSRRTTRIRTDVLGLHAQLHCPVARNGDLMYRSHPEGGTDILIGGAMSLSRCVVVVVAFLPALTHGSNVSVLWNISKIKYPLRLPYAWNDE